MPARGPELERMLKAVNEQRAAVGVAPMTGAVTEATVGQAIVEAVGRATAQGQTPQRAALRAAVRYTLALLEEQAPGRTVEVRIPPFAAIQCVAGPRHTRGTPPNVVETDPLTWLGLATGRLPWADALARGLLRASGQRSDISQYLPVLPDAPATASGH